MIFDRKGSTAIAVVFVLGFSIAMTALAKRQDGSAKQAATAAASRSTPEMDRLKFYLGEWDYTETYPKGAKNTGLYTSKLGPGGNSLINTFHSQGPAGESEGMLVYTWDATEKCYKAYVFGGDFPGALVETGQFEGDDLVFRAEISMGGTTMKLRNTTHLVEAGKLVSDEFAARKDGAEALIVHVEARKR